MVSACQPSKPPVFRAFDHGVDDIVLPAFVGRIDELLYGCFGFCTGFAEVGMLLGIVEFGIIKMSLMAGLSSSSLEAALSIL